MLVERRPHPALRRHIRSYYGFTEETPRAAASAGGPGSSVVLVISFERATRSSSGSPRQATGRPVLICSKRRLGPESRTARHSRTVPPGPGNEFRRITGASPTQYLVP